MLIIYLVIITVLVSSSSSQQNEEYNEELYVKPLPNGHIYTYFQFTNRWKLGPEDDLHHTYLMPLSISTLLKDFDIKELHVSLTQGLWRYETWGYPVIDSAPGAEMWAWFTGNLTTKQIDTQWKYLSSTMSGMLCSSLNFIDKVNSVEPLYSFRPKFGTSGSIQKSIRYATLPGEIVCTENLTPWKKFLPCNSNVGFASLLNSGFIHNTNYHSLELSIRTLCDNEFVDGCVIEFTQTAGLVYDPKLLGGVNNEFSIRRMFGQGLNGICTLANTSKIYVDITDEKYDLTVNPDVVFNSNRGGNTVRIAEFDIQKQSPDSLFNIAWIPKKTSNTVPIIPMPPISAHRFILGHGQERGKIVTKIINSHWTPLNIILMENIPWFVPCYMHTLIIKSELTGKEIPFKSIHFVPGEQRERPYHLEVAFILPPQDTVEISFDFDYIFLKWLEYPPDANHGHYLGSAVISTTLPVAKNYTAIPVDGYLLKHSFNASRSSYFLQIHTEPLVLVLPTPDFSMPYNVICLACTVVALAFGPIHSVTTKRIIFEKADKNISIYTRIKNKLFRKKEEISVLVNDDNKTSENLSEINQVEVIATEVNDDSNSDSEQENKLELKKDK